MKMMMMFYVMLCCCGGVMGKVASAVGLDNGLLLASVVWLNIVKKNK